MEFKITSEIANFAFNMNNSSALFLGLFLFATIVIFARR